MTANDLTRQFLESTADLVVVHTTTEGVITGWQGGAVRVLGYTAQEAIGMSLSAFFIPPDIERGLDAQEIAVAIAQGQSEDDRWHLRKDGGRFWASGALTAVEDAEGRVVGLCKILRDKTDVKTQIQALENLVGSLRAQLEAERRAVSSLAHELRNPLMPIATSLALLQRADAAHLAGHATKTLMGQVELLKRLIDDLDSVGADLNSGPEFHLQPVNLDAALLELVDATLRSDAACARTVSLVLPKEDIWVDADPSRLRQMLLNLLNNAVKYTGADGRIDINATIEDAMAVIRMEDDGIGIAAEMLPRIFDMFTREGRQPDVEGKGVGLAVVRQLAAAHGGVVDARSPGFNLGSTFSLRIPICTRHQPGEPVP